MAQKDEAVLAAAKGYIFTAPENTTPPTPAEIKAFDPAVGLTEWDTVGHTSREDLPEFGFDGGDSEALGTWQNDALRTVQTEASVDFVTFYLAQFDETSLGLYFGSENAAEAQPGEYIVKEKIGGATRKAILIIIIDGDVKVACYAPKTDVKRDDSIEMAVDEFAAMPVRATFLKGSSGEYLRWISEDIINTGS